MAVKQGLLALLAEAPAHGYQLKADFEARTGGSWELNIGQVYTTLQRLERDGLVETVDVDEERTVYGLTPDGHRHLERWYQTPIVPEPPPRDELAIKVLLAIGSPQVDEAAVIQRQRVAVVEHMQTITRRKRDLDPARELEQLLHLDALLFRAEAEVRWLDLCDARLRQRPTPAPIADRGPGASGSSTGDTTSRRDTNPDATNHPDDTPNHHGDATSRPDDHAPPPVAITPGGPR